MRDEGLLTFYKLENTSQPGSQPVEKLISLNTTAFYKKKTIGVQRRYLAKGADYSLDKLVRCYNTTIPEDAVYVILEDKKQYRIGDAQEVVDEDAVDLSLERLGKYYEVLNESNPNS